VSTPTAPSQRSRIATDLLSDRLTARRAAGVIGAFTLLLTISAALLAWLVDRDDFPSLGVSAWWALQTVTTVGYGDFVPTSTEGRVIGSVVMIGGIGFLAVVTASIAAAFVENARRRLGDEQGAEAQAEKLDEILVRLERLERAVDRSQGTRSGESDG
jgi:voltage-gated potassium channel